MTSSTIRIRRAIRHVFPVKGSCVWRRRSRKNYLANWSGRGDIRCAGCVSPSVTYSVAGTVGKRYCGGRWRPRNVGRALITRSGSGPGEIYGPTNVLTSARGNLSAVEREGEESGGERRRGGTFSLANPGDDVLSY